MALRLNSLTILYLHQQNASSRSKHEYFLDWSGLSFDFLCIITSNQSSVSPEYNIAVRIFEAEKMTLV